MKFDHVAVTVQTESMMKNNVKWYCDQYDAKVLYQDATWSLLSVGGVKIAFVLPHQHPPPKPENPETRVASLFAMLKPSTTGSKMAIIDFDFEFDLLLNWHLS